MSEVEELKKLVSELRRIVEEDEKAGFGGDDRSSDKIDTMLSMIELLRRGEPVLRAELTNPSENRAIVECMRVLLIDRSRPVRQQTTRLIRYLSVNESMLQVMNELNLDVFIVRCLEREDAKYLFERLQSLKWMRHVIDNYPHLVTRYVAMSLLCVSLFEKDDFRILCLDALRALFIQNTGLIVRIRGVSHIIDAILDPKLFTATVTGGTTGGGKGGGSSSSSDARSGGGQSGSNNGNVTRSLLLTVLYLLDKRETRRYLRASVDVRKLISPWHEPGAFAPFALSDAAPQPANAIKDGKNGGGSSSDDSGGGAVSKEDISVEILLTMLKSITGVFYLSSQKYCLSSLIRILSLPNEMDTMNGNRRRLFDVLDEIISPLFGAYSSGGDSAGGGMSSNGSSRSKILDKTRGPNLVVNYVVLILVSLIHNGLIDALIAVGIRSDVDFSPRARLLLARIQYLAARFLPRSLCSKICEMPSVMESAVTFSSETSTITALAGAMQKRQEELEAKKFGVLHTIDPSKRDAVTGAVRSRKSTKAESTELVTLARTVRAVTDAGELARFTRDQRLRAEALAEELDKKESRRMLLAPHRRTGGQSSGSDHLKLSESRNFATNMIIELSEATEDGASAATGVMADGMSDSVSVNSNGSIDANEVCVRLGPPFDINSTFMRYRYSIARDIPALMFDSKYIPYHTHQRGIISVEPDRVVSGLSLGSHAGGLGSPTTGSSMGSSGTSGVSGSSHLSGSMMDESKSDASYLESLESQDYFDLHRTHSTGFFSGRDAALTSHFLSGDDSRTFSWFSFKSQRKLILDQMKANENASHSHDDIRQMLERTQVTNTKDFLHWNMDEVFMVLNGPLWNKSALNLALKPGVKFIKRLLGYLKPSRTQFCQIRWTRATIRHAHCAAQLFRLMTSCDEGVKFSFFIELVEEIMDCLKEQLLLNLRNCGGKSVKPIDPSGGGTSATGSGGSAAGAIEDRFAHLPMSRHNMSITLSRVYPILIGILSESERGYKLIESNKLIAYLLQLPRKEVEECQLGKNRVCGPNDYLLRQLAFNFDFSREQILRMFFTTMANKGSFYLIKSMISQLELLYRAHMPKYDEWSIDVLGVLLNLSDKPEIALHALRVLEKINVSQSTAKSRSYLSDLLNTNPTDEKVGLPGQFLFIKMLSSQQGFKYLERTGMLQKYRDLWLNGTIPKPTTKKMTVTSMSEATTALEPSSIGSRGVGLAGKRAAAAAAAVIVDDRRRSGAPSTIPSAPFVEEYTEMLENSLLMAVNRDSQHVRSLVEQIESEFTTDSSEKPPVSSVAKWLSLTHHLVHEMKTDEEELYYEYLAQLPWRIYIEVIYPSGEIKQLNNECFFDYYHFLPFVSAGSDFGKDFPSPIGPGIVAVIMDPSTGSSPSPFHVDKSAKIHIQIDVGCDCLLDFYSEQIREKTVQLSEAIRINDVCSVVNEGQAYFVFEPTATDLTASSSSASGGSVSGTPGGIPASSAKHSNLTRVFISVKSEQKTHSLVRPLPHLYGELAKTKDGCNYIAKTGDLNHFVEIIAQHSIDAGVVGGGGGRASVAGSSPSGIPSSKQKKKQQDVTAEKDALSLRSALWAVGMIGSTATGFRMLQQFAKSPHSNGVDVVKVIAEMALESSTLSIRGTCLYVLGLLSRSVEGMSQLSRRGFSFPADNHEFDLAVAVPTNVYAFFQLNDHNEDDSYLSDASLFASSPRSPGYTAVTDDAQMSLVSPDASSVASLGSSAGGSSSRRKMMIGGAAGVMAGSTRTMTLSQQSSSLDLDRVLYTRIGVKAPPKLCRPMAMRPSDPSELLGERGHTEETILAHISGMVCHVTRQSCAQTLNKLHTTKPSVFINPLLFREVVKLLSTYYLPLAPKRFIIYHLFDAMPLTLESLRLFDGSFDLSETSSLDYMEIRQWRLDYKQQLTRKKQAMKARKDASMGTGKPKMKEMPTVEEWSEAMGPTTSARTPQVGAEPDSAGDAIAGRNPLASADA